MQGSLFPPASNWKPPTDFPELDGNFALDLEVKDSLFETRGPGWAFDVSSEIRGHPVGYGVAAEGFQAYYPIRHLGGGNLDEEPVLRWLQAQCKKRGRKVFHNGLYDLGWAGTDGIVINPDDFHDTQYQAALIDSSQPRFNLDFCLNKYLGERKDEDLLRIALRDAGIKVAKSKEKGHLWKLHAKYVGPYGEQDAGGTYRLDKKLAPMIDSMDLNRVYGMERSLLPLLLQMRRNGVRVDLERAEVVRAELRQKELAALKWIQDETGFRVREGVPTKDAAAILRKFDISIPKSEAGNDSVIAAWLESIEHPVGKAIVRARRYQKAYRDFIDSGILQTQVNGRIHASFHPLMSDEGGTVTGRFSCTNPNLQQIPNRDIEIGPLIRSIYVGEEGQRWGKFDFSSQEPRWTLHFAGAIRAPGAAEAIDTFRRNPHTDFHGMMTKLIWPALPESDPEFKQRRRKAKDIFLGLCYGMGGAKLCRTLGLPTDIWVTPQGDHVAVAGAAGKELLKQYNSSVPFVKKLSDEAKAAAERRGYIKTYLGRRRLLTPDEARKALNTINQGSSADQIKLGMLAVWRETGKVPLLQVHDETGYSIESDDEANNISRIMEGCIPDLLVPHICEPFLAPSWGQCK